MVLQVVYRLATFVFRPGYYIHAIVTITSLVVTYAFAQGRATTRERDLNARTILITGGFTPLGLTLISSLASRGARIVAVSPYPLEHAVPTLLIPALREETKNENIFAEYADLGSPASIREFCTRYLTGDDQRLDAIIYAHEYQGVGSLFKSTSNHEAKRVADSLASFLITTLLLPALLVAPVERDIRIIHLVNPFYAAAVPSFTSTLLHSASGTQEARNSLFVSEGNRALRTIVLARHLQRVLNALPNRAPTLDQPGAAGIAPMPPPSSETKPDSYPSNIVSVSACPGISRNETVCTFLGGEREYDAEGYSLFGLLLYYTLYPVIWMFAKSPAMATQTVLHALFLPTPLKRALIRARMSVDPSGAAVTDEPSERVKKDDPRPVRVEDMFTEVLKPGALYRECSVVTLGVQPLQPPDEGALKKQSASTRDVDKKDRKKNDKELGEDLAIVDDGELGGEAVGRTVWEWYEQQLKAWEANEKNNTPKKPVEEETPSS